MLINRKVRPNDITLVKDKYSGKAYGNNSFEQFVNSIRQAIGEVTNELMLYSRPSMGGSRSPVHNSMTGRVDPVAEAEKRLASLEAIEIPTRENYIQSNKIVESYGVYQQGWDEYFRANFQNPRITEEQQTRTTRQRQELLRDSEQAPSIQALTAGNNLGIGSRRAVGTGVTTSTFNPFSRMEAGLGL